MIRLSRAGCAGVNTKFEVRVYTGKYGRIKAVIYTNQCYTSYAIECYTSDFLIP
jgi:hypothetical protein